MKNRKLKRGKSMGKIEGWGKERRPQRKRKGGL